LRWFNNLHRRAAIQRNGSKFGEGFVKNAGRIWRGLNSVNLRQAYVRKIGPGGGGQSRPKGKPWMRGWLETSRRVKAKHGGTGGALPLDWAVINHRRQAEYEGTKIPDRIERGGRPLR